MSYVAILHIPWNSGHGPIGVSITVQIIGCKMGAARSCVPPPCQDGLMMLGLSKIVIFKNFLWFGFVRLRFRLTEMLHCCPYLEMCIIVCHSWSYCWSLNDYNGLWNCQLLLYTARNQGWKFMWFDDSFFLLKWSNESIQERNVVIMVLSNMLCPTYMLFFQVT